MKNFLLTLLFFAVIAKCYGLSTIDYGRIAVAITKAKGKIAVKVEIKSAFPGGDSSWVQSIEKNITRNIEAGKRVKKGKYMVSVIFIVVKDGSLAEIRCENDPGYGLCQAILRAIKKTKKWFPAEQVRPYGVSTSTPSQ